MTPLFFALAGIALLFVLLLGFKSVSRARFCVICASVGGTWVLMLGVSYLDFPIDRTLLALLMGQSIVGLYYLVEKRLDVRYHILRLPFLLTLTAIAYSVVVPEQRVPTGYTLLLLGALWLIFAGIFAFRTNATVRTVAEKIIACCRDW
ncbi:hypothetical protein CO046_02600 [Candidatus Peregrinibacteria bacterium CG_4_9_14_0_2_um_filter_53_11]|nr:MAG: hypothetical protein CO046_02600 [Candidatus Peregrinibacteria bacterium CG_4_9_14_0_2_um_filter_53_11]